MSLQKQILDCFFLLFGIWMLESAIFDVKFGLPVEIYDLELDSQVRNRKSSLKKVIGLQSGYRHKNIPGLTRVPYDLTFS